MMMKRFLIAIAGIVLATGSMMASGDGEVIVTRQLTTGQRNALPEKTITVETKRLVLNKKADPGLVAAITQVMDTIANEDYQNRTFALLIEPRADGHVSIAAQNDDIVTRGKHDASIYHGDLEHGRYHFVVLTGKDNKALLEQTFKRQGKMRFVQEFEFVQYPTPRYPTRVVGQWSATEGFKFVTVIINEDPNAGQDMPAVMQD